MWPTRCSNLSISDPAAPRHAATPRCANLLHQSSSWCIWCTSIKRVLGGTFSHIQDSLGCKATQPWSCQVEISFDTAARTSGKTSKGSRRRCNNTYKTSDINVRQLVFVCFCFLVLRLRKQTYLIRVDTASSCDLIFVDRSPQEIYGTRALKKALKSTANRFDDWVLRGQKTAPPTAMLCWLELCGVPLDHKLFKVLVEEIESTCRPIGILY